MLNSKLLSKFGLKNYISGSNFDIRDNDQITENLNYFASILNIRPSLFYTAHQTHTNNIKYADGVSGINKPYGKMFEETDGLITDRDDVALVIKFADCTPVVLYDPIKKVQAVVHSGWRGTVKKISAKAINMMVTDFNCNINDILCFIGPSIDQNNYEVGSEVYDAFKDFEYRDTFFQPFGEKYKLSMIDANLSILIECKIPLNNIEVCRISTFDTPELNSARRDKDNYKLNSIITMISHNF